MKMAHLAVIGQKIFFLFRGVFLWARQIGIQTAALPNKNAETVLKVRRGVNI